MTDALDMVYETCITAAWCDVFETDVMPDDDFFALGGDSLRALQVLERLSSTVQVPEALATAVLVGVFENASPRAFAAFLRSLSLDLVDRHPGERSN